MAEPVAEVPSNEHASRLKDAVERARERMAARLAAGAGGLQACAEFSVAHDELVRWLWDEALRRVPGAASARLALVATGGWGRRHLCPYSDIDFAILTPDARAPVAKEVADAILYPLWDARIRVGHAIRTPKEAARLARDDLASATALLDVYPLAGDDSLVDELRRHTRKAFAGERAANDFVRRLVDEKTRRHDKFGASLFLLEPNLKQGIGALRDLATGVWAACARWGVRDVAELMRLGYVSARQVAVLTDALDFLLRVRSLLHLHLGRAGDQLTFEIQEAIAPGMYPNAKLPEGDVRPAVAPAVEALMRRYYLHARGVVSVTDRLLEYAAVPPRRKPRIVHIDPTFVVFNGKLSLSDPALVRERPWEMVRLFRVALDEDLPVYAHTRELVSETLATDSSLLTGEPRAAKLFLDLLCDPRDARQPSLLEQMHDLGILNAVMPEFAPCTCRVQHDLYHVYTVDQHQLYTVALLKRFARGELADSAPVMSEAVAAVQRPASLYLAALLHDVGKPLGKGHADKGARLTATIAQRLAMAPEDAARAEYLVRQHLTMAHLSQRRDLSDQQMIEKFAERTGDEETLRQLYILTHCDTAMTNPGNLSEWKEQLLRELYLKARAWFRGGSEAAQDTDAAAEARRTRQLVRQLAEDEGSATERELDEFFRGLDDRYFAGLSPQQVARHYALATRARERDSAVEIDVLHHPRRGHSELAVVARDAHGLLATVAGALSANKVDILEAVVGSRATGGAGDPALALDLFYVRDGYGKAIPPDDPRWARIERDLRDLLAGASAKVLLAKRRKASSALAPRQVPQVPTQIKVDNEVSEQFTVIDVSTQDRVGVLHTIARTLADLDLDIALSKVHTEAARAIDVFYVTEGTPGQKITDPDRLAAIEQALHGALAELAS